MLNSLKSICRLKMSQHVKNKSWVFVQHLNPRSNQMEWKFIDQNYDFNQEIALSCYGDMLHDDERNKKFGDALKKAIEKVHSNGKEAHVLDIGTGTGLLSMLAVKYGADRVTACEEFSPMSNCAIKVIQDNNMSEKIKIVKAHSTSLVVGENIDHKANILVSEVFDTELIGEGAIQTFNHAFKHLLTDDCIVIPSSGTVYAQVVESDLAQQWNKLKDWSFNDTLLKIPEKIQNCPGATILHDIQLSEFHPRHFKILSNAIPVFRFNWAKNEIPACEQFTHTLKAIDSGKAQVVFVWWDLKMDEDGEIIISCAPFWEHPYTKDKKVDKKTLPWRDHWMQAVYFLPKDTWLDKNETYSLTSGHDQFSYWFQFRDTPISNLPIQTCYCGFHLFCSRTRIGAMNDDRRRDHYLSALKDLVNEDSVCVIVGDMSLLAPLCALLGAKKVYVISDSSAVEKIYNKLEIENKLSNVLSVQCDITQVLQRISHDFPSESLDVLVLSEPYFRNSILPWDNVTFWYKKEEIVKSLQSSNKLKSIKVLPKKMKLRGCAVEFDNLWKIATPLNTCEEFSLQTFDALIENAKNNTENYTEAQPLWEYPGIALSHPVTFFDFDLAQEIPKQKIKSSGKIEFECAGRCDGVALWMEYDFGETSISFGPVKKIEPKKYIDWDMYERQGVHLFRQHSTVKPQQAVHFVTEFDTQQALFNFDFALNDSNQIITNLTEAISTKLH